MCLYPKLIKNPKYIANKKNKGNIPILKDKRCEYVPVGCGKCIECMKQKSRNWMIRLQEEIKSDNSGYFVTLTFSTESLISLSKSINLTGYELDNEISKLGVRYFLERWRKKYKKSIKHWLVTELGHGTTEHVHIHGLLYTKNPEDISNIWNYGYVFIGDYVNIKTINYIVKYVSKIDKQHSQYKPIILCSKGIGRAYFVRSDWHLNKFKGSKTNELYKNAQGYKIALPIYYRNKIYDETQRELLWLNRRDEQTRYVCGEKIDISNNDEAYY